MATSNNHIYFKIKENSWIARIAAWKLNAQSVAIVVGNCIHIYNCNRQDFIDTHRWVKHELCHVQQFREHGLLPFLVKYIWESLQKGYYLNKYEVQARAAENDIEHQSIACLLN